MKKYFDVIGPNEVDLLRRVRRIETIVIQPKYDGSNVLKYGNALYTRNLNPVPPQWEQVIRTQFREIVNSSYDFYFEFGGYNNAPAGYRDSWHGEWDYRVLDAYGYRYHLLEKMRQEGLKVVETIAEFDDIYKALEFAIRIINTEEMKKFEGVVVKAYGVEGSDRKLEDGVLFVKVKHENVSKWANVLSKLTRGEYVEEEVERAPNEEIRKELHKILTELKAKGIDIKRIGVNEVWPQLQKELQKHGYRLDEGDKERVRQLLRELKRQF